jgi:hypothetical protein
MKKYYAYINENNVIQGFCLLPADGIIISENEFLNIANTGKTYKIQNNEIVEA